VHSNSCYFAAILTLVITFAESTFVWAQSKAPETSQDAAFVPQSLTKLAVIVSPNSGGGRRGLGSKMNGQAPQTNQQRLVEDVFVQQILQLGHVVVARSDLKSVLKEQAMEQSGLTDSNAVEVGKLLNVPAVLVVRINEYTVDSPGGGGGGGPGGGGPGGQRGAGRKNAPVINGRATVGARLVNVETGAVLWQGNHTIAEAIPSPAHIQFLLAKVADKLANAFPAKEPSKPSPFEPKDIVKLALIMEAKPKSGSSRSQGAPDELQLIEDKLSIQLGNKGYSLVSRSDIQTLMQEKQFQSSGLTEENVAAFGKLLNVPVVMVVRMTDSGPPNATSRNQGMAFASLGARLVSVETGEVLWCRTYGDSKAIASKVDQAQVLTEVTQKIGNMFPDRKKN
jgi:curli biogenesis system outer membrane secretion channel CsgG